MVDAPARAAGAAPSRRRKGVLAAVAMALFFGALEVGAAAWERLTLDPAPTMPLPRPANGDEFSRRIAAEAEARHIDIPMVADEYLGWKLPPAQVTLQGRVLCRINTDGLRGPEITPKPAGTVRLLTLGDSSIFGDSVAEKDVLSSVAAERLSAAWGVPVEGVIGAVPGHDSLQAVRTLGKFGTRIQPDWVVVGSIWSDLYAGDGHYRVSEDRVQYLRGPLRHLATYRVFVDLLTPWLRSRQVSWVTSQADIAKPGGEDARVDLGSYVTNLLTVAANARELGARTAYLILPAPIDFDVAPPPETVLQYREAMRQVAERVGAPLVDGPRVFREKGAGIVYFSDQVHPNTLGHHLLGEALAEALVPTRSSVDR